jgi:hypothetical protein
MANAIEILINAKNQTNKAFDDAIKNMKGLDKATSNTEKSARSFEDSWKLTMAGINQGIEVAKKGIDAFKKVIDFTIQGAALERLEIASGQLADSMGQDMDEIVFAVREASQGMVSDADIMQSAARALMLGVGQSAEDMAQLMEVAAVRGRAMGVSTTQAFNDIVTGIGRQSRMILDNLGIVLDLEQVYEDYATQLGKTSEELTDAEKKQAMVNAVIEDTAPLLDEVGDALVDNMGKWEQANASWQNATDEMKKSTSGLGAELADVLGIWGKELFLEVRFRNLKDRVDEAGLSVKDFKDEWQELQNWAGWTMEGGFEYLDEMEIKLNNLEAATQSMTVEDPIFRILADDIAAMGDAAGESGDEIEALADATNNADAAMKSYSESLLFAIASEGLSAEAALQLAYAMGLVDEQTVFATEKLNEYQAMLDAGEISMQEYIQLVTGLGAAINGLPDGKNINIKIKWTESGMPSPGAGAALGLGGGGGGGGAGGGGYTPYAAGGPVKGMQTAAAGTPIWTGEVGPEPFFPAQNGRVLSNSDAMEAMRGRGGGGGASYVVNINTPMNFADRVWVENELAPYIEEGIRKVTARG